jgi:uncharacterized protein YceH (UPF0502 family)
VSEAASGPAGTPEAPGLPAAIADPFEPAEIRVLGCLLEKEVLTPDVYPMTVNALVTACNQTTNRFPVVRYGEHDVTTALVALRDRGITRIVYSPSNRAPKHRHVLPELLELDDGERAALTVLLLRGAQTVGEVKGRSERLHPFPDLGAAEAALEALAARGVTVRLPRRPGQKEERYAHLLAGPPDETEEAAAAPERTPDGPTRADRLTSLEQRVLELEQQVVALTERLRPLLDE